LRSKGHCARAEFGGFCKEATSELRSILIGSCQRCCKTAIFPWPRKTISLHGLLRRRRDAGDLKITKSFTERILSLHSPRFSTCRLKPWKSLSSHAWTSKKFAGFRTSNQSKTGYANKLVLVRGPKERPRADKPFLYPAFPTKLAVEKTIASWPDRYCVNQGFPDNKGRLADSAVREHRSPSAVTNAWCNREGPLWGDFVEKPNAPGF
jgi:hypothetical protein